MATIKPIAYLLLICLLGACGSTPRSNYYMLSADAEAATAAISADDTVSLGIKPIEIPAYLDRSEMVSNRDDNRLAIAEYQRWAEPLEDGIERVLMINLSTLLNARIQVFPWPRNSQPTYSVQLRVMQLSVNNSIAELVAQWSVADTATKKTVAQRISQFGIDVGASKAGVVADTYSRLLLQLSEEIAAGVPGR